MNVSNGRWNLGQKPPIETTDIVLAYHCQNQEFMIKVLLEQIGNYCWEDVKRFGIPLWLKDTNKLKQIVEQVAKEEYKRSKEKDADRVSSVAVWYLILKKKNVLIHLYKDTQNGGKIYDFLSHDFSDQRWRRAASNNAYKLFSQKRYSMAATFYLLGGYINEAV